MTHSNDHQSEPERQHNGPASDSAQNPRPFDNSGLNDIPQPRSDDPPYRNWWVVEGGLPEGSGKANG